MTVTVPSGFRFVPTDLELVRDYLLKKLTNQPLPSDDGVIEYDVYNTEPWNLPVNNIGNCARFYSRKIKKRRYYFVRRECYRNKVKRMVKCGNGTSNRLVGYWKKKRLAPQAKLIRDERKKIVGTMKAFVFHYYTTNNNNNHKNDNERRSIETKWIMHEYTINSQRFQPWVLCSLINKSHFNININYDHNNNYIRIDTPQPVDPDEAERLERIKETFGRAAWGYCDHNNNYIRIDTPQPVDPDEAERLERIKETFGSAPWGYCTRSEGLFM